MIILPSIIFFQCLSDLLLVCEWFIMSTLAHSLRNIMEQKEDTASLNICKRMATCVYI